LLVPVLVVGTLVAVAVLEVTEHRMELQAVEQARRQP
jgi:hypothetical protein